MAAQVAEPHDACFTRERPLVRNRLRPYEAAISATARGAASTMRTPSDGAGHIGYGRSARRCDPADSEREVSR